MAGVDVRTQAGDVYELNGLQLVYGSRGIELTLTARNMATVRRAMTSDKPLRDRDNRDRAFLVSSDAQRGVIILEALKGEIVEVASWLLLGDQRIAA